MSETLSPSLREAIEAAMSAAEADPAPASEAPEPARDDAGRFTSTDPAPEAPEAEAAPAPAEAAPPADDYDEGLGVSRDLWAQMPTTAREQFRSLAQQRREAEDRAKGYEPLERVLAPRKDALRATFGDEARALEQLFHLSDWANRDFGGFVRHLAEQRGIDLRQLVPAAPAQDVPADPIALARAEARREAERLIAERDTQRALSEFEGNAAYEYRHDAEIRRVMAGLLQSGAAADLPTAYSMATKAHPTISAKLAERERAEAAKRQAEEAARRAQEKAAAAVSVRGSPGTARAPAQSAAPATIRAAAEAAWAAAEGRI